MLHHFFAVHGFGESHLHLHADNCGGQNKNHFMMFYLMWRVLTDLHKEIIISFLLVEHTKFAPDWCFGLLKRQYKQTKIGTIEDIAAAVEGSACVNFAQLVGKSDGTILVPTYDWSSYFSDNVIQTYLKGITKMHHFRFSATHPGAVSVHNFSDDSERKINLLKDPHWRPTSTELPELIPPPGLSLERQWYLYQKIREFCPEEAKDIVCPLPPTPLN